MDNRMLSHRLAGFFCFLMMATHCSCRSRELCKEKGMTHCPKCCCGINYFYCCECDNRNCFSGQSTVVLQAGGVVNMAELQVGQNVLTVSDSGEMVPTKVLTFLQKTPGLAEFLQLTTESGHHIQLSSTHLLYVANGNSTHNMRYRFASEVQVGDHLLVANLHHTWYSMVVDIMPNLLEGSYVPMTEHGTLLVDGILASCYASFDHDLAHAAMTPLRWFPQVFDLLPMTEDGQHGYSKLMKYLGRAVLPKSFLQGGFTELQKIQDSFVGAREIYAAHSMN